MEKYIKADTLLLRILFLYFVIHDVYSYGYTVDMTLGLIRQA